MIIKSLVFVGSASGNPTPQIFWKLDGFPLPEVSFFVQVVVVLLTNLNFFFI